jgi:hypothetical protein
MGDVIRPRFAPETLDQLIARVGGAGRPAVQGARLVDRIDRILKAGDPSAPPSTSATALEAAPDMRRSHA